jgi:hypothetical protein
MSDIFVKTAGSGSTGWKKATNIFVKIAGLGSTGWKSAVGVWIKNVSQWVKVWPLSGIFATRVPYIGYFSSDAYSARMPNATYPTVRIGDSYFGNNAQWDLNGWTASSYTYKWKLYDQYGSDLGIVLKSGTGSGWTSTTGQDELPTTIWTSTNSTNSDNNYLGFEATAVSSTSSQYNGLSISNKIKILRLRPINSTATLSTNSPTVGTPITYSSTWVSGEAYKEDSTRTTIYWYTNSTSSTTGGTYVGSGSSYTPSSPADVGKYIYVEETRYNSGTDYDLGLTTGVSATAITTSTVQNPSYQLTGYQRRITLPSAFNPGTTLYVSTNGFVNWGGADPGGSISIPNASNSGITLAPLSADLRQGSTTSSSTTSIGGLWYYADVSNYYITWYGNHYQDAAQVARYQIKFYWGASYADVYFINNSLTSVTPSTTAIQNNSNIIYTWSNSTSQSSTLLSTASMNRVSDQDGVDDGRTILTASQPIAPSGGSASISGGTTPTTLLTLSKTDATGTPTPTASWVWRKADGGTGGNSFSGGTILQYNGTTYTIQNSDVGYSIRAEVTWSNGILPNQIVNTNAIVATAGSYTVTWNATANGGSGGGSTTQTAGIAHTAPSALKTSFVVSYSSTGQTSGTVPSSTQGYYQTNGYYDTSSLSYTYGPIAVGGSFTPPSSITMYARYSSSSNAVTLATQGTLLQTGYTFGGWNIGGTTYAAGSSYTPTGNVTATAIWTANLTPPSGGTVSIGTNTGNYQVGSVITVSTSGWSPTPTGYVLELHNGTNPVLTSDPSRTLSMSNSTTGTYTITSSDVPNYFKAWATASNSAGSNTAASSQVGPATTAFVAPSAPAPSLQFLRTTSSSRLDWYCDYPSISGNGSISSMQFEIRTTAGGGTLLASGTRAYPGAGSYPYSAAGTIWAFRMGTADGDIAYSSSARYGRARVVMLGSNGSTYYGTWSGWL